MIAGLDGQQGHVRHENLRFRMDFDATRARMHRTALSVLVPHIRTDIDALDTLKFDYTVHIQYLGDVHRKLDAMLEILEDEEMVLSGDIEEMLYGRCLIHEVLQKLDRLIEMEADR